MPLALHPFRLFGRLLLVLAVVVALPAVGLGTSHAGAMPVSACVDFAGYSASEAPAGSDDLGTVGGTEDFSGGEIRTLRGVLGGALDLRITWTNDHEAAILDPGATPDFVNLDTAAAAIGADGVLRHFPRNDQRGTVTFEFLWAGTNSAAPVELDQVLMGGQRDFAAQPEGVAEFVLRSGGTAGARIAPTYADPDVSTVDADVTDGISGLGTTPIIELDQANFGVANATAYNETRRSYVSVGALDDRDWTLLDWGGAVGDTLQWDLYGSNETDPELADPAASFGHGGLSAYIAGLCVTAPEYDLALVKTLPTSPTTLPADQIEFEVTVTNQGTVAAGAHSVTDHLPLGTSWVSDTSGVTASVGSPVDGRSAITWAFSDLAAGSSTSFSLVVQIDDSTLTSFRNDAWITADSGTDADSDPDVAGCTDGWDDHDDSSVDVDGPGDACDDHDAEILVLDTYSLGNQVWFDVDDSGTIDAGEPPLVGIWMELFRDADADGLPDDTDLDGAIDVDDSVATASTGSDGLYLFDGLAAGRYVVCIPPMEWDDGGPLVGMISSTGAADSSTGADGDDHGSHGTDGYVCSGAEVIGDGEPTAEAPSNDSVTPDTNSDLTIDFGFWRPTFDLALRKQLSSGGNEAVVAAGDPVSFTITVFNQGTVAATGIEIVDYVPAGLTLADADWTSIGGVAVRQLDGVTLQPGEQTSVSIVFTVSGQVTSMRNIAEISAARPVDGTGETLLDGRGVALVDIDSVPDATNAEVPSDDELGNADGDEDDHDVASVTLAADGPGGGALPATGGTPEVWYPATIALLIGALLLVLERQRRLAEV